MMATTLERYYVFRDRGERVSLRLPRRALVVAGVLTILIVGLAAISLMTGSYQTTIAQVIEALWDHAASPAVDNVVWQFRFPRTLAAALAGAMMALSGGALQNVTRNALADPSLIGISQGAGLAVVAAIVMFPELPSSLRPAIAFGGGLAVAIAVQSLAASRRNGTSIRFILLGIGMATFIGSLTSALLTYGDVDQAIAALAWLAGSVNAAGWSEVWILAVWTLALSPMLFGLSRFMGVLRMGETAAAGLGVPVNWARPALIAVAVGFAASATAIVGPIGFVGLVAPHAARRLARAGMGLQMLNTALCGALLVLAADLLGRSVLAPAQIPAGLVTAIVGVPAFFYLLQRAAAKNHF